jgi:hypothetical protein
MHPLATGSPKTSGRNQRTDLTLAVVAREGATAIVVFCSRFSVLGFWVRE